MQSTYVAEGSVCYQKDETTYIVCKADEVGENAVHVATAAALADAIKNGVANVELVADITMTEAVTFSKDITVDLHEKTLTIYTDVKNGETVANGVNGGAQVVIQNGSLKTAYSSSITGATNIALAVNIVIDDAHSSLTLHTVSFTTANTAIFIRGDGTDIEGNRNSVNVIDSTIDSKGAYCISTNASLDEAGNVNVYRNVNISVEGSTLTSIGTGILLNVAGNLTVTNSTIKADEQGVFVRAGTATISNSTLGTTHPYDEDSLLKLNENWGDGNNAPQAALVVGNRNGTYLADAVCTLSGKIQFEIAKDSAVPKIYVYDGIVDTTAAKYDTTLNFDESTAITVDKDVIIGNGSGAVTINGTAVNGSAGGSAGGNVGGNE